MVLIISYRTNRFQNDSSSFERKDHLILMSPDSISTLKLTFEYLMVFDGILTPPSFLNLGHIGKKNQVQDSIFKTISDYFHNSTKKNQKSTNLSFKTVTISDYSQYMLLKIICITCELSFWYASQIMTSSLKTILNFTHNTYFPHFLTTTFM